MSDFIPVLDILENAPYGAQRAVRDEVVDIESGVRRAMDRGLTPDEMKAAQAVREASQAASAILDKLFA